MNGLEQLVADVNSFTNSMLTKDVVACIHCTLSKLPPSILKEFSDSFERIRYGPLENIPGYIEYYNSMLEGAADVGYITFHKVLLICCLVRWNNPYVAIKVNPPNPGIPHRQ